MKLHFFKHVFSWLAPEGPPGVLGDVFFLLPVEKLGDKISRFEWGILPEK